MKRWTIALFTVAIIAAFGSAGISQADHCGNGGSPQNAAGSCETSGNNVKCGEGTASNGSIHVYANSDAVEVCNDGEDAPVQGRVGGTQDCQCVYADGDKDNDAPANGWARIDASGINCGPDSGAPSYNSAQGDPGNCG